ncbi:hypothetical protein CVT26_011937 [Gymnopilus dilepis]|uniref:Uncharacterized protein n=1 Tax=Gymnopilus dilepis TaxID=231916 RepID=A0A409X8I7_9AGAR|nr:hypothetical protein CVT26_011937 [Gymnopilus dilepis]
MSSPAHLCSTPCSTSLPASYLAISTRTTAFDRYNLCDLRKLRPACN